MRISDWSSDVCSSDLAVMRGGGVDREIRVILDPARLQGYGIAAAQVNMRLRQLNANQAGGRAEVAGAEQSMRVLGNAQSAYALGQNQISLPDGRTVKLAALGEVKDMFDEQRSVAKMAGHEVLSIGKRGKTSWGEKEGDNS